MNRSICEIFDFKDFNKLKLIDNEITNKLYVNYSESLTSPPEELISPELAAAISAYLQEVFFVSLFGTHPTSDKVRQN